MGTENRFLYFTKEKGQVPSSLFCASLALIVGMVLLLHKINKVCKDKRSRTDATLKLYQLLKLPSEWMRAS